MCSFPWPRSLPQPLTCRASFFSSMTKLFHKASSSAAFPFCLFPRPQPRLFTATHSTITSQDDPNSNLGFHHILILLGHSRGLDTRLFISSHLLQIEFIALTSSSNLSRWSWAYLPHPVSSHLGHSSWSLHITLFLPSLGSLSKLPLLRTTVNAKLY